VPVNATMPPQVPAVHPRGGVPIVLTAPLTETIDHAGYFIQMSMASLPIWLEGIPPRPNSRRDLIVGISSITQRRPDVAWPYSYLRRPPGVP
jgi:hypothetical protein